MSAITQLSPTESTAVLDMLYAHVARTPVPHCRVRWQPNTLVLWDNRCVQHHAVWDHFPPRAPRPTSVHHRYPSPGMTSVPGADPSHPSCLPSTAVYDSGAASDGAPG